MDMDKYFDEKMDVIPPFEFNEGVAQVFDDMVSRSVPFYHETHKLIIDLIRYRFKDGDTIYDLGCSTGTTIQLLSHVLTGRKVRFVGVDNSQAMLDKANEKLKYIEHSYDLVCTDLNDLNLNSAGIVIMNYTLQFLSPEGRLELLKNIYKSLRIDGTFILSEKIESPNEEIQELITCLYYDYKKRNGYSNLEISQKREALENVLITLTPEQQIQMMKDAGFEKSEMIFRWYNFASYIGVKS
jgi:tRNA (cmo5U34)-methyltransferase